MPGLTSTTEIGTTSYRGPVLPDGYALRPLAAGDAAALAAAYTRNREHLAPWDPIRSEAFFTEAGQAADVAQRLELQGRGVTHTYLLTGPGGEVVGRGCIQNVVRGAMWGGTLSYWVDHDHLRRGLARAVVDRLGEHAVELGLHRLEAGTMVENVASQRVLESAGYERYGLVPQFLFIGGAWRDHVLYQRVLHDRPPG